MQPNVAGIVLAGSADFKTELGQSDMFDPRLQAKIINVVDVSYGGENGFNQVSYLRPQMHGCFEYNLCIIIMSFLNRRQQHASIFGDV